MHKIIWGCFLFLFFLLLSNGNSYSQIAAGSVMSHSADDIIPYNWFSYLPSSISKSGKNYILVIVYGGLFDYTQNTEQVEGYAHQIQGLAERYKFILILPSIPRNEGPDYYTMAFDRANFLSTTPEIYKRPDLKINLMINKLKGDLRSEGYEIEDKIFVEGFSAGGMFAQRYCLLHPEKVMAISAGQCGGSLTLPVSNYNGTTINWAVGVNDFDVLTGYSFHFDIYKTIPQYFYIGSDDNENSHVKVPGNFWTQEQIDFIHTEFGDSDPKRIENMANYINSIGCKATFQLYQNIGHEVSPWNTPDIMDDIYEFLSAHKEQSPVEEGENEGSSGGGGGGCFISSTLQ